MYRVIKQMRDHFTEVVARGIISREEAEYIVAECLLQKGNEHNSYYIERDTYVKEEAQATV